MSKENTVRQHSLATQQIDESGPGTILRDFEILLSFVEQGLPAGGQHCLLPLSRLSELDERMSRPLRPRLKRPQQRSFPQINGLYLLLRTTQLAVPEGSGKRCQVVIDPAMHARWLGLNATERYFNLLEAWLARATWQTLGLRESTWARNLAEEMLRLWQSIPDSGCKFKDQTEQQEFLFNSERCCNLALLELFGLVTVERGKPLEGQGWIVQEVHRTRFGNELFPIVFGKDLRQVVVEERREPLSFGVWQPLLKQYFPQWTNNLELMEQEFRDGVYYFKASLGKPWRRIAIPAQSRLDDLADCIIRAFDFDGDHLYAFLLTARDGRSVRVDHPHVDFADQHTDQVVVGQLPLGEGQSMLFHYDSGADWHFHVELEKIASGSAKVKQPKIVASRGKAPPEYEYLD